MGQDLWQHPAHISCYWRPLWANLAFTWKSAGQQANACNLLRICVAKQQLIIGPGHPDTVSNSNTLLEWETEELSIDS